jgi:hypothetical protein
MTHIYYNNVPDITTRKPEIDLFFKNEYKISNYTRWDVIIHTNDTIFLSDG